MKPKIKQRFYHSRVLDSAKFDGHSLQLYQVTKVAQGRVYYAPVYDAGIKGSERLGKSAYCDLAYFPKVLGKEN